MRKLFLFISVLFTLSTTAQVENPFYLAVKQVTNGTTFLRASWKADRRDLTVRNHVTWNGSSTLAGQGATSYDSSVAGRTMKYLDDLQPGAITWGTYALGGQSSRNWIEQGNNVDAVRNVTYAVNYQYNTSSIKDYPRVEIIQDASNWVVDGTSNATNLRYIRSIARRFVEYGAQVFIITPQPRDSYTTLQRQQIEEFYFLLEQEFEIKKERNIRLVKVYDTLVQQPAKTIKTEFSAGDFIHLNNLGHKVDYIRLTRSIDSVYRLRPDILRHELQVADSENGPWTDYNNNIHPDTGFLNIPLSYAAKFFRVKTVYTNSTETGWSNLASSSSIVQTAKMIPPEYLDFDDFSASEMGSGMHLENWWTGFASHDPRGNWASITDTAGYYTSVAPFRHKDYPKDIMNINGMGLYRGDRGVRFWYDWIRDKDINKLSAKVLITELYALQQGGDKGDTLFFYNGDRIMEKTPHARLPYFARPDSLLTPFAMIVQGTDVAWRPEWNLVTGLNDSMRYMLVIMRKKQRSGYETYANFSELVIYGKKLYAEDTLNIKPWKYTGVLPKRKPIGESIGTNNVGIEESQLIYDPVSREYITTGSFIQDTTAWPNEVINLNPWNYSTAFWDQEKVQSRAAGRVRFETIRGAGKRAEVKGGGNVGKSAPVTEPFMEPEAWQSYKQQADFYRHYAALYGNDPNHTDAEFRFTNKSQLPGYGRGYFDRVEPGNEETTRGISWLATAVAMQMQYDGYEGEFKTTDNKKQGVKGGDSTFELVHPATVYADSMSLKVAIFFSKALRNDGKVIFKYANGHHYPRKYVDPSVTTHDPTLEEQVGASGASAEWDGIGRRLDDNVNILLRETDGDTSKRYVLSEYGYDNYSSPSKSVADLTYGPPFFALWTIGPTPKVAGRDSLMGKGWLTTRAEVRFAFTRIGWYNEFMITNVNFDPNNNFPGLFATSGKGAADGITRNTLIPVKWKHYWTRASFYTRLQKYVADTLIAYDSLGLCLAKLRHQSQPDSVVYAIWKGSWNGSTLSSQEINVGNVTGNANKYTLSTTSPIGATTMQAVSTNKIFLATVTEEPIFFFVQEAASSGITIKLLLRKNE